MGRATLRIELSSTITRRLRHSTARISQRRSYAFSWMRWARVLMVPPRLLRRSHRRVNQCLVRIATLLYRNSAGARNCVGSGRGRLPDPPHRHPRCRRHHPRRPGEAGPCRRPGRARRRRRPRPRPGPGLRHQARHRDGARLLRGAAGRPRHRRRLQPAAEQPARRVDDRRARGGQARAVREAVHHQRRRGPPGGGRRRAHRPGGDGGLPLPLPPAHGPGRRDRPQR